MPSSAEKSRERVKKWKKENPEKYKEQKKRYKKKNAIANYEPGDEKIQRSTYYKNNGRDVPNGGKQQSNSSMIRY